MTTKLTILGCASSGGVPRVGGTTPVERWGACDPSNPKNTRQRCSVLVSRKGAKGTTYVVIDTGPDFRAQMLQHDVPHLDGVVYTHEHADHLHGIDDLRPYALIQRARIDVYMDERTLARAKQGFGYVFDTPAGSSYPPILNHRPIDPEQDFTINGPGGPITFSPVIVIHGDITSLGFRIGDVLYLPDVSGIPPSSMKKFENLNTLILDSLRKRPHPSHFNVEQALDVIARTKPKRAILTNLHNDLDYTELATTTPRDVEPAYDGLSISIKATK